jgi:hypothetical protein
VQKSPSPGAEPSKQGAPFEAKVKEVWDLTFMPPILPAVALGCRAIFAFTLQNNSSHSSCAFFRVLCIREKDTLNGFNNNSVYSILRMHW